VSLSRSRSQSSGRSRGHARARPGGAPLAPRSGSDSTEASESRSTSDTDSLTDGINTSTSWGVTTSRAIGLNESLGRTVQRSREFLVEPEELQRLPPSAVIVSYASGLRRHVVLADANPAIATLSTVTWRSLDEVRLATETARPGAPAAPAGKPASPTGEPAPPMGEPTAPPRWVPGPAAGASRLARAPPLSGLRSVSAGRDAPGILSGLRRVSAGRDAAGCCHGHSYRPVARHQRRRP
jgi:hypothetical protein